MTIVNLSVFVIIPFRIFLGHSLHSKVFRAKLNINLNYQIAPATALKRPITNRHVLPQVTDQNS